MTPVGEVQDLVVLVADLDAKIGLQALLERGPELGFRRLTSLVIKSDSRDPGVCQRGHDELRPQHRNFSYALTVCDFEGCGREQRLSRQQIKHQMEERLQVNGWQDRSAAVVIKPELENWIWGDWASLEQGIRWTDGSMRAWMEERGLIGVDQAKPARPKEAFQRVLRQVNARASASHFADLARSCRTDECTDLAFAKFLNTLRTWFPL